MEDALFSISDAVTNLESLCSNPDGPNHYRVAAQRRMMGLKIDSAWPVFHASNPNSAYAATSGKVEWVIPDYDSRTFDIKRDLTFYKGPRSSVLVYRTKNHTRSV
jgi:hypothetical protein